MDLKAYLTLRKISISEAARQTGFKTETFRKWVHGQRVPRPAAIRAVMKWSGGLVCANDFCATAATGPAVKRGGGGGV